MVEILYMLMIGGVILFMMYWFFLKELFLAFKYSFIFFLMSGYWIWYFWSIYFMFCGFFLIIWFWNYCDDGVSMFNFSLSCFLTTVLRQMKNYF